MKIWCCLLAVFLSVSSPRAEGVSHARTVVDVVVDLRLLFSVDPSLVVAPDAQVVRVMPGPMVYYTLVPHSLDVLIRWLNDPRIRVSFFSNSDVRADIQLLRMIRSGNVTLYDLVEDRLFQSSERQRSLLPKLREALPDLQTARTLVLSSDFESGAPEERPHTLPVDVTPKLSLRRARAGVGWRGMFYIMEKILETEQREDPLTLVNHLRDETSPTDCTTGCVQLKPLRFNGAAFEADERGRQMLGATSCSLGVVPTLQLIP